MKCYVNGIMHSMIDDKEIYHQMATQDGKIIAFDDEVNLSQCDEVFDLNQGHLFPGFVDAHLHMMGYGEYLSMIHLSGLKTKDEVINHLLNYQHQDFMMGLGYVDLGITKHDLDLYFKDQIVLLRHNDYHSLTLNSKALAIFKIVDDTGILKEDRATQVMQMLPKHSLEELKHMLEKSVKQLYTFGITGGHTDDLYYYNGFQETYQAFEDVMSSFPFRAHLLMHHEIIHDYIRSKKKWGIQTPYLELGSVKMFYDGTMSSKTALMQKPYLGTNTYGEVVMGKENFIKTLSNVRKLGLTVAIHVIGDKGLDEVIDLLIKYPPQLGQKDRVIHAPWAMKETLIKMVNLPITYDIQPQFLSSDLPRVFSYVSVKPDYIFPWKTYLDHNLILSGSSDAPVETPNPLLGIKDAIYRRSNSDKKQYVKSEVLSHYEAIKLYTTGAHAQSVLQPRGYLQIGYLADFTVFNCNLLELDEAGFDKAYVTMTIIDDKTVYAR